MVDELIGTRKGTIKVTQVACIEVDLDKTISNVFPLAGINEPVSSLEDLLVIFKKNAQAAIDWNPGSKFETVDVTILAPEVQEQVDLLRKKAQDALDEANQLIKG